MDFSASQTPSFDRALNPRRLTFAIGSENREKSANVLLGKIDNNGIG